ncbi:membrane-associated protein, putative [Bodo saltans]|uniref:Membrane-associated protein, putative n=1 Tax=Bodo saltans TaxID=75058 RepID=A0A0S4IVJ4_BODSA|nr:membrane-associated protein, putative [Bodo saltans]|eukprot:CUG04304.1 membrane-associated protein, putative [Bodo saltans]
MNSIVSSLKQRVVAIAFLLLVAALAVHWSTTTLDGSQQQQRESDTELSSGVIIMQHGDADNHHARRRNDVGRTTALPSSPMLQIELSTSNLPPAYFPSLAATKAEKRIPPLVRLRTRAQQHQLNESSAAAATTTATTATSNNVHDVIHEAYQGEYGWRFKSYISSKLENDFYVDVLPFVNDQHWPALVGKYRQRVSKLLLESAGRVALNENLVDNSTNNFLAQCDDEENGKHTSASSTTAPLERCFGNVASKSPPSEELFSRFLYEFVCLGEPCSPSTFPYYTGWHLGETKTSFIEPLFANMRHPKFFLTEGVRDFLEDKEYMMVDKWAFHNLHTRWKKHFRSTANDRHRDRQKSIFVDMGASVYFRGQGGASQKWFVGVTDCLCVPFTDMFLFEAKIRSPPLVWSSTPGHLHPNYYWYNYPLEVSAKSWRNPFNHLLHKLSPDDVVTVKVDFDSPGLESAIIRTILQVPELYQTIDELFYEYHVKMAYMHRYWPTADSAVTVRDSIDVFRALRQRGIRAHSWV